ncbi:D-beta-hydroxybutyrate dehydrogenase, mitochondrial isoform X5 [Acanthopagrus latus]|uniref:D-beta-hydroxybutyrate dehydrogenase, mitochondrial isoform X5 n=1 Tax=Acanthopagrus latus TaxID=8177 RepID=UPI00187C064C|nr:D-beta-hydroxybutyrate dehydrogenase, mitochondrial isoform X5 [Acanthopagrus latus]
MSPQEVSSLQDKGGEGAKELEEFHSDRMKVVQLDVCSDEQVNQAVEYIKDNLADSEKGLWAVVNNAGVSTFGEVEFTSMDTYKQVSEVNLWGTIRVTKAVLPLIRRAKGRVVNLASMYGRMGNIMRSPYCVSKYGVEAFSDCLRYEMKTWGVKVSVIEPGNFIVATGILTRDIVANTANKLWSEAPAQVKEDYGKGHFEQHMALMRSYCNSGQKDVAPVLDDITDAITSKRPYTRPGRCNDPNDHQGMHVHRRKPPQLCSCMNHLQSQIMLIVLKSHYSKAGAQRRLFFL